MSERTDVAMTDDELGSALRAALEHRAGGRIDGAAASGPVATSLASPADASTADERFALIDAAVAERPRRNRLVVPLAAAALLLLVVGMFAVLRASDGARVDSIGPADTAPITTEVPTTSVPTTVAPGSSVVTVPDSAPPTTAAPPTTPDPTEGLLAHDRLAALTLPNEVCMDEPREAVSPTFTLVDGVGTIAYPGLDPNLAGYRIELHDVIRGDLTGDGREDAMVRLGCVVQASDGFWDALVLVTADGGQPKVLTWRRDSGFPTTYQQVDAVDGTVYEYPRWESILDVQIRDGQLVVRWNQTQGIFTVAAFDQRQTTVTYRWDGTELVPLGESDVVIVPGDPMSTVPPGGDPDPTVTPG